LNVKAQFHLGKFKNRRYMDAGLRLR